MCLPPRVLDFCSVRAAISEPFLLVFFAFLVPSPSHYLTFLFPLAAREGVLDVLVPFASPP